MKSIKVWEESIVMPTYEVGPAEKNPMFLEKRVYQGSSGKVYPYPITEIIRDEKVDKTYRALVLENQFIKVTVLPELGGRIQRAIDKSNNYDFVYFNQVIKPALVGLLGPWISGGIEFNWPQHHRPSTYMPLDYRIDNSSEDKVSITVFDVDQMNGTQATLTFTLYADKAYIELSAELYNRTSLPQTFLWWANPAVAVNEHTQSIFPPDVRFVMDHGKRDVSRFPISRSVYYKKDYSDGVDISYYRNIPVPTSYMAERSNYDFIGNYDHGIGAGMLHVADHHISPGKKQWTWGDGDFGRAWDRNLTDEDGPYIELMTGVFTDNQPDFTWIKPFETKRFKQYFMPYKGIGVVRNASTDIALAADYSSDEQELELKLYAAAHFGNLGIRIRANGVAVYHHTLDIQASDVASIEITAADIGLDRFTPVDTSIELYDGLSPTALLTYQEEEKKIEAMPSAAKEPAQPEAVKTSEELLFIGRHLEQIRHARTNPADYYLEGLKRDPLDSQINVVYGTLLLRQGNFESAETHATKAIERISEWNKNPINGEAFTLRALSHWYRGAYDKAYDDFYQATWSYAEQHLAFYYLAAIACLRAQYATALDFIEQSIGRQADSVKARAMKVYILKKLGKSDQVSALIQRNKAENPFDYLSLFEEESEAIRSIHSNSQRLLELARHYAEFGAWTEAINVLNCGSQAAALNLYYEAYYRAKRGEEIDHILQVADEADPAYVFPNALEDIAVLGFAIEKKADSRANYYLANLLYDRKNWQEAEVLWEAYAAVDPSYPTVLRNLSLLNANKKGDYVRARQLIEQAFKLDPSDIRILMERDQLYRRMGLSFEERLEELEAHEALLSLRDPLYVEYITLLNACGRHEEAYERIGRHRFHPWEGGEGKITAQYELALMAMAKAAENEGDMERALSYLQEALHYPENLGEGKLEGQKDNALHYRLGQLAVLMGDLEAAKEHFKRATHGASDVSPAVYYNDQPADTILYQGLAWKELGESTAARRCFSKLIDAGEQHLNTPIKPDFFAVSLPEMTVYEDDEVALHQANCYYFMALGEMGLDNRSAAIGFLEEAIQNDPSHLKARYYLACMK